MWKCAAESKRRSFSYYYFDLVARNAQGKQVSEDDNANGTLGAASQPHEAYVSHDFF